MHQGLGHHQPPLHAARQGADIGVGLVRQAQRGQQFVRAPLVLRHAVEAGLHLQRLARGEEDVGHDLLRHDAEGGARVARLLVDVAAPDGGGPAGLVDHPGQDVDQRRLARAVGPQQAEHRAARNDQIDAAQGGLGRRLLGAGIGLFQPLHLDGVDGQGGRARSFGAFSVSGRAPFDGRSAAHTYARPPNRQDHETDRMPPRHPDATRPPARGNRRSPPSAWPATAAAAPWAIRWSIWTWASDDFVECGYCDRRFVLSAHPHSESEYLDPAARPPEAH